MKKRLIALVMTLCVAMALVAPARAISEDFGQDEVCEGAITMIVPGGATSEDANLENNALVSVTDEQTGKTKFLNAKPISKVVQMTSTGAQEVDVGYSVLVPISIPGLVTPNADTGKSTNEAGVLAKINVVYTISANKEKINITKFYGSWTPSSYLYNISNRMVGVNNKGVIPAKALSKTPTGNSFSYNINWGYQNFVTGTDEAPFAWSEALVTVGAMSGTQHKIELEFHFPDGR